MIPNWEVKAIAAGLALGAYDFQAIAAQPAKTVLSAMAWAALALTWRLRYYRFARVF